MVARTIARNFTVNALEKCHETDCKLYEKYDSEEIGKSGGGGEYVVQTGFGWTNGVLVEFICLFGNDLLDSEHLTNLECDLETAPGWKWAVCTKRICVE